MKRISTRTTVLLLGLSISLLSTALGVFVLADLNARLADANFELNQINESLRRQAEEINQAEIDSNLAIVLYHVSQGLKGEAKAKAAEDAALIMQEYLKKYYAAVNNIPQNEILAAENEELTDDVQYGILVAEAVKQQEAGNAAEAKRLAQEAVEMEKRMNEPKTGLGKKLGEIEKNVPDSLDEKAYEELILKLIPYIKDTNDQFIAGYQNKQQRIKELQNKAADLTAWTSMATYLVTSLQMLGLLLVLAKDLIDAPTS